MSAAIRPRIGVGPFRRALVIENPDPSLDDHLRAIGIEPFRPAVTPDEEGLIRLLENEPFELLYKRSSVRVTERVLDAAPHLFAIMLCCIGDDSVDKRAAAERGILVTNDPVSNGRSVAELVIGELICLSRRVFEAAEETRQSRFVKSQERRYEVRGKTLGILGMGNIGKQVAQLAVALGMKIAFHDNRPVAREVGEALGFAWVGSTRELFACSDFVSAHVSAHDYRGRKNDGLITADDFAAFVERGEDSPRIFINLARGSIHSAEALIGAVEAGHVTRAFVDVYPDEPRDKADVWVNPYAGHPRIYGTPHIGASTLEAQPRIAQYVANTTRKLSHEGTLRECVYAPKTVIGFDSLDGIEHVMTFVHGTKPGTKKAIDTVIYNAGASNLESAHRDFLEYGIAYETVAIDHPLNPDQLDEIVREAARITGDLCAIRAMRSIHIG